MREKVGRKTEGEVRKEGTKRNREEGESEKKRKEWMKREEEMKEREKGGGVGSEEKVEGR